MLQVKIDNALLQVRRYFKCRVLDDNKMHVWHAENTPASQSEKKNCIAIFGHV